MLRTCDILDEKNKCLREKNTDMEFPLSKDEKKLIYDMSRGTDQCIGASLYHVTISSNISCCSFLDFTK